MRRNNRYIIWLNGVEVYNTDYGTGEFLYGAGDTWSFAGNSRHPDLRIGAARIWDRGLTDAEILGMYNNQKARFGL